MQTNSGITLAQRCVIRKRIGTKNRLILSRGMQRLSIHRTDAALILFFYSCFVQPSSIYGWILAFLLDVHRLCGVIGGRLSHFLLCWLRTRTGWQCDQPGKNPLKYSAVAENWTRPTGRTDSELFHWAIMTRATGRTDSELFHWAIMIALFLFILPIFSVRGPGVGSPVRGPGIYSLVNRETLLLELRSELRWCALPVATIDFSGIWTHDSLRANCVY